MYPYNYLGKLILYMLYMEKNKYKTITLITAYKFYGVDSIHIGVMKFFSATKIN